MPVLPYQPNPYHARMRLASRLAGGLSDDGEALPGIDLLEAPSATPVETTDFTALTMAQDSSYLPTPEPQALPTPPAATPLAPAATAAPSFDWSKLLSSVITAGGAVTTGVVQGQSAQNIARTQAAQAASGQAALAQQAALLNANSLSAKLAAMPSWLPWALGGGTILVIGFIMVRKHRS